MNLYKSLGLLLLSSLCLTASNVCTTTVRDDKAGGQYSLDSIKVEEYKVVGATVTYTTEEGQSSSEEKSLNLTISAESQIGAAFTLATGLSSSRIQSSTLTFDWVMVSNDPVEHPDEVTSAEYWTQHVIPSPWKFLSWTVGPPPTDKEKGVPTVHVVTAATTRWTTTSQLYTWVLDWKESKCE